jgi:hypothetical protein
MSRGFDHVPPSRDLERSENVIADAAVGLRSGSLATPRYTPSGGERFMKRVFVAVLALAAVATHAQLPPVKPGECPTDLDIQNIHTSLSAKVVPPKNASSLHRELAKAETCRRVGSKYTHDDWKRLEEVLRGFP